MKLLVDTQLLVWAGQGSRHLPRRAAALLSDTGNRLIFSTISVAEVAIKRALNRPDFLVDPRHFRTELLANDYDELPLSGEQAGRPVDLPAIHKDPFDRLLIAQALSEGLTFLTADAMLGSYLGQVIVV